MSTNQIDCKNCEQPYHEEFQFCPHCGQKANDELTIGVLFYNTISNYFSFDARFFKSFMPLMFKPGYLAQEFIKGKRLMYLHPAQMYLFITVIFFFLSSFYSREFRDDIDKGMQQVLASRSENVIIQDSIPKDSIAINDYLKPLRDNSFTIGLDDDDLKVIDSLSKIKVPKNNFGTSFTFNEREMDSIIATGASDEAIYKHMGMSDDAGFVKRKLYSQMLKFYKSMGLGQIYQTIIDSIPLAMFFLLPLFALLLKIFFFNKGRYAHHLVFSFYYFSFLFTLFSILFLVNRWIIDIPDWIDWLIVFSTFFYLVFAIARFYRQHWLLSFVKTGVIGFLFMSLVLPFSLTILGIISFLYY
ncbi:DUF3667 domain-containing protein [Winogradskyella sp. PC D3.3]